VGTPRLPDPTMNPAGITLPDDGDNKDAASVNVALAALEDMIGSRGVRIRFTNNAAMRASTTALEDGDLVFTNQSGFYRYNLAGTIFGEDTDWIIDAAGLGAGQYVQEDWGMVQRGKMAAMGTVPGGIYTAADNVIPYVSTVVTRAHHMIAPAGDGVGQRWNLETSGLWNNSDVTAYGHLVATLDLPHNCTLTSLSVSLKSALNTSVVSITKPTAYLLEINPGAGTSTVISNVVVDPSASSAAYKALHSITVNKQADGITALNWPIDKANKAYRLIITSEAGTDAIAGSLTVFGVTTICTVTEQDKG